MVFLLFVRLEARVRNIRRGCRDGWETVICGFVRDEFVRRKRNYLGVVIKFLFI